MNKEKAFKWADALESGEYRQGRSLLFTEATESYCCLGVLCSISELGKPNWKYDAIPTSAEAAALDLKTRYGHLPINDRDGHQVTLVTMNDSGFTFSQIADVIRCFYESL